MMQPVGHWNYFMIYSVAQWKGNDEYSNLSPDHAIEFHKITMTIEQI